MQLSLINSSKGKSSGKVEVSDGVFAQAYNESLIHQIVVAYMAGARKGNHAQKTRSQVRGGGAKPWRQKGTGRARAGTSSSPIWRGGGATFAKVPRSYEQKVNKKMYRGAMRSILSELVRQERLIIIDQLVMETPKTKSLVELLNKMGAELHCLLVTGNEDNNLSLASRNLPYVDTCLAKEVDPVSLVGYQRVILTADAVKQLEEKLA